jgi:uncharacterized membrane protein YozB (DUF420 family)
MAVAREPKIPNRILKRTLAVLLILFLIAASVFLALGSSSGIAARPGVFGTRANLFSDINLTAQLVLLVGLSVGAVFARRGNISTHQYNQTTWVLINIVLTIFIMVISFSENILPGIPANLRQAHAAISTVHASLGLVTILCGVYLLLRMNKLIPKKYRIRWWQNLMRVTLGLYWLVGLLGVVTYYIWYIR